MFMDLFLDPSIIMGFASLVVLEIVLGIDNLIFIAIIANKLPPEQREKARVIGLSLALFMRIGLLLSISWIMSLTKPFLNIWGKGFSWKDIILLLGGLFLVFKATVELHNRVEGEHNSEQNHTQSSDQSRAKFWYIILQILLLDIVFSLDSVITAVGMVEHVSIMIMSIVIAIIIMIIGSKSLVSFVNKHPTIVILCLGFLLMIGFSLIVEGMGLQIPKGYLYGAMGFALLIELINQISQSRRNKALLAMGREPIRMQVINAIEMILGENSNLKKSDIPAIVNVVDKKQNYFLSEEKDMAKNVLSLSSILAKSIMTEYSKIDIASDSDKIDLFLEKLQNSHFSRIIITKGNTKITRGFIQKKDVLNLLINNKTISISDVIKEPITIEPNTSALDILSRFKKTGIPLAFVVDQAGTFLGIVTVTDVMSAIAGDIPEEHEIDNSSVA